MGAQKRKATMTPLITSLTQPTNIRRQKEKEKKGVG
jgi:hypothetical protein